MNATIQSAQARSVPTYVNPMPLWQALFYFGLPAFLFRIFLYSGIPTFVWTGLTPSNEFQF